MKTKICFTGDK